MTSRNQPKKKRFVVRRNCEFSTMIEATTLEEALQIANNQSIVDDWERAWSEIEAEEE